MKTTSQVALQLNLSQRRVIQAAQTLGVEKFGKNYCFTDYDIERIKEQKGKRGRPKY